ncbi:MAG TPA: RNB domain-containing ribonuclease [Pyrinomonadaceae bacterium]|nr:RNB domain-containing ribonuclease [Pyrinomonadaceae bacterium]
MSQTITVSELRKIAEQTMVENGFQTNFSAQISNELYSLKHKKLSQDSSIKDLRALLWSSIDNDSSKDLDQIEVAEQLPNGDIRLLIAIADVDEYVRKGSTIDAIARKQTVSVYTETKILPILPHEISENLTSLLPNVDRLAIVIEMVIKENGDVPEHSIYRALTHNYAKLTYSEVGEWLDENGSEPTEVTKIEGLREQILLQQKAADRLLEFRRKCGSLEFESIESSPVFEGGEAKDLNIIKTNSARKIIENFMVAANVEMAEFLDEKNFASIRRIVKTPARWERIREIAQKYGENLPVEPNSSALSEFLKRRKVANPEQFPDLSLSVIKLIGAGEYVVQKPNEKSEGHFGLAVRDYTHSTAPNRRYPDLIVQRMVKAALKNQKSPYTDEELAQIAEQCNEQESAARKVERKMRKVIAASVMQNRIGEVFEAIVTGITPSGTFARILRPPVDGRIVRGEESVQVGEKIRVKLLATNIHNGYIDFANDKD